MSTPNQQKSLPITLIAFVALAVAALALIFVALSTFGDDVPNNLPAATESSPGN